MVKFESGLSPGIRVIGPWRMQRKLFGEANRFGFRPRIRGPLLATAHECFHLVREQRDRASVRDLGGGLGV
eukprot:5377453-Prymnesium_polylepis.1